MSRRGEDRGTDEPAATIAMGKSAGAGREWQSGAGEARALTIEEAAVLQTFPLGYPWRGSRTAQFKQVGNAVPPGLAEAVLRAAAGIPPTDVGAAVPLR